MGWWGYAKRQEFHRIMVLACRAALSYWSAVLLGLPRWPALLLWFVVLVCRAPVVYRACLPCSRGVP
eukprot:9353398-Pyramimonas_sp.AAC.1